MWRSLLFGCLVASGAGLLAQKGGPSVTPPSPAPSIRTETVLGADGPMCGVGDQVLSAMSAWPLECAGKLKMYVNSSGLRGLDADGFRRAASKACENVSQVSGLALGLVDRKDDADIYVAPDGMRGGILAWCEFPTSSCSNQVQCRFNSAVNWSESLFLDTLVHELGHGFGLPHTGDKRDIMYPSIVAGRGLDGKYGPHYSIPQLVARYGEAKPQLPDVPLPPLGNWPAMLQWLLNVALTLLAGYLGGKYQAERVAESRLSELRRAFMTPPPPNTSDLPR